MRKIYEQLIALFREFLMQRDYLVLLVPCEDSDVPLMLKALRDLDRESPADIFLLFGDEFINTPEFVDTILGRLQDEHKLTNEAVKSDDDKLPPLPNGVVSNQYAPPIRLEAGLRYARSLIDARRGQHFLWAMGPAQIVDPDAYLELLAQLPPKDGIQPWMRGARIVTRVPANFAMDQSPLAAAKRVAVKPFTIPHNVFEEELQGTANDPKAPMGDRMQSEVQLAYIDYAHSRFDMAIARFSKALAFYQWADISAMQGLILCGLGDVARRKENWKVAHHFYACAAVPAAKDGNPMLLSTIVQNLAVVAFQENRFADAEERYSELVTLKRAMIDEVGLVEALEWQGICQEKQQAFDRAVLAWEEAALICKSFEMGDRLPPLLGDLKRGYQALDRYEELAAFESEWNAEGARV
jgi:hypothetical protein